MGVSIGPSSSSCTAAATSAPRKSGSARDGRSTDVHRIRRRCVQTNFRVCAPTRKNAFRTMRDRLPRFFPVVIDDTPAHRHRGGGRGHVDSNTPGTRSRNRRRNSGDGRRDRVCHRRAQGHRGAWTLDRVGRRVFAAVRPRERALPPGRTHGGDEPLAGRKRRARARARDEVLAGDCGNRARGVGGEAN